MYSGQQMWFTIRIVNYRHCHLIGQLNRLVVRSESYLCQPLSISANKSMKADRQWPNMDAPIQWHTQRMLGLQWRLLFVAGILRIHGATGGWTIWALSGNQRIPLVFEKHKEFQLTCRIPTWEWTGSCCCQTVSIEWGNYLVLRQSQFGVTCTRFSEWANLYAVMGASVGTLWDGDWLELHWYQSRNPSGDLQSIRLVALQPQDERKTWQLTGHAMCYARGMYQDHG